MGLGAPELLVVTFILALGVVSWGLPIYGAVKAFNAGENGWGVGMLIGMLVPFGFVLAIVYLAQQRPRPDS